MFRQFKEKNKNVLRLKLKGALATIFIKKNHMFWN